MGEPSASPPPRYRRGVDVGAVVGLGVATVLALFTAALAILSR